MYVSTLTGRVAHENWIPLTSLYEKTVSKNPPHGLMKSFLVQSEDDPPRWKIVSVWDSKAAFENFAASSKMDLYVELMCDSGSAPYRHGYVVKSWYERV